VVGFCSGDVDNECHGIFTTDTFDADPCVAYVSTLATFSVWVRESI